MGAIFSPPENLSMMAQWATADGGALRASLTSSQGVKHARHAKRWIILDLRDDELSRAGEPRSNKMYPRALQRHAAEPRRPGLAGGDRKGAGQRSRCDDFA